MGLQQDISNAWKDAMKAREATKDVLSLMKSEIKSAGIEGGVRDDVPDELVLKTLTKMAKQRKDSIASYQEAGREDLAEAESFELNVIQTYLPKMLSIPEVEKEVESVVAGLGDVGPQDFGRVMGQVMGRLKGKAEGSDIQAAVKKFLQS